MVGKWVGKCSKWIDYDSHEHKEENENEWNGRCVPLKEFLPFYEVFLRLLTHSVGVVPKRIVLRALIQTLSIKQHIGVGT